MSSYKQIKTNFQSEILLAAQNNDALHANGHSNCEAEEVEESISCIYVFIWLYKTFKEAFMYSTLLYPIVYSFIENFKHFALNNIFCCVYTWP